MFENATTVQIQPGMVDRALHILRAYCVPVLKAQRGFINLGFIPDYAHDKLTVISLWQTKAHALAVEAVGDYLQATQQLALLLAIPAPQPAGEIRISSSAVQPFTVN